MLQKNGSPAPGDHPGTGQEHERYGNYSESGADLSSVFDACCSRFNGTRPEPAGTGTIKQILDEIRTGKYRKQIEQIRAAEDDKEKQARLKRALPAVTFGCTLHYRALRENPDNPKSGPQNLISATGLFVADMDHVQNRAAVKHAMTADANVLFAFDSPTDGLKVGLIIPGIQTPADYAEAYPAVERYFSEAYDLAIDPACKNLDRLCFLSWDRELLVNTDPIEFDVQAWKQPKRQEPPQPPQHDNTARGKENFAQKVREGSCRRIRESTPNTQHVTRRNEGRLLGGYIASGLLDEAETLFEVEQAVLGSGAKNIPASMRTVQDGINYGKAAPLEPPERPGPATEPPPAPDQIQKRAEKILRDREPCGPFDLSTMPDLIRDYVNQLCHRTEADPVIILMAVLTTMSARAGKRVYIPDGEFFEKLYANVWSLCIALSGGFKTTALNKGCRIAWQKETDVRRQIQAIENEMSGSVALLESEKEAKKKRKQYQQQIKELQAQSPILPNRMSGEGLLELLAEGQAGLIPASEFGEWLDNLAKSHNQGLKPLFTDLYDVPKQYSYATKGGGLLIIPRPFISIAGVSTMAWVKDNVTLGDVGSGFFARFLLFYPPQKRTVPPALPKMQGAFDTSEEDAIKIRLDELRPDHPMLLSQAAKSYFEGVHQGIYAALDQLDDRDQELLGPYAKRWSPYVLKLAMLFQIAIDPAARISVEAVRAGTAVVEYAIKSTVHLFRGDLGESPFQQQCRAVLEFIAKKGGTVERHKLIDSKILSGGAKEYDEVLGTLDEGNQIIIEAGKPDLKKYQVIKLI